VGLETREEGLYLGVDKVSNFADKKVLLHRLVDLVAAKGEDWRLEKLLQL
jgi:hypothetical protein